MARKTSPLDSVVVNGRCLVRPTTGVERYAREVTRLLSDRLVVASPGRGSQGFAGHVWEQVVLPRTVGRARLLWSPANTGPLSVKHHVVTIHDISPIEHPEWFVPAFARWYGYLLPRLARQAHRVITVSEFTRRRIIDRLGVPEARVVVIPHGVTDQFRPRDGVATDSIRHLYGLTSSYLLVVGSVQPRKNLERLLRVWLRVRAEWPSLLLAVVGATGKGFRASNLGATPGVLLLGSVPEQDLPALYAGAYGFVQPSLYEGFGLPLLEAMACGLPTAASNTSALPEVGGHVALFMDPLDEDSMGAALRRLVEDDAWRARSVIEGRARAGQFTWERTAARTWEVLREAAEAAA